MSSFPGVSSRYEPQRSCGTRWRRTTTSVAVTRQGLARADEDRDARPAPALDLEPQRDEGLRVGVRLHALDRAVARVLAADRVARDRPTASTRKTSSRRLGIASSPPDGRLHRGDREHLEQVVLDDVADRAHAVVERAAPLDAEVLGERDLDRVHVLAAPDGLEERVREAEVDDVLHGLLPEEVVDPVEPVLGEDRRQPLVQLARGGEIGAERLLDDEPRVAGRARRPRGPRRRRGELRRRDGDVEDRRLARRGARRAAARRAPGPRRRRRRTSGARAASTSTFSSTSSIRSRARRRGRAAANSSSRERAAPDARHDARQDARPR